MLIKLLEILAGLGVPVWLIAVALLDGLLFVMIKADAALPTYWETFEDPTYQALTGSLLILSGILYPGVLYLHNAVSPRKAASSARVPHKPSRRNKARGSRTNDANGRPKTMDMSDQRGEAKHRNVPRALKPLFWGGRRLLAGGLLIASGVGLVAGSAWRSPLPDDKLVVAVASLTPGSSASVEEIVYGGDFSNLVLADLNAWAAQGVPIKVQRYKEFTVSGKDDQEQRQAAKSFGESRRGHAHVVLWGLVQKEDDSFIIRPRLTFAVQIRDDNDEARPGDSNYQLEHLWLNSKNNTDALKTIEDVVTMVSALAYYRARDWDRAIESLRLAQSNEANLYRGRSLYERAQQGSDRQRQCGDLLDAISCFESIDAGQTPGSQQAGKDATTARKYDLELAAAYQKELAKVAYFNKAIAYNLLASYSPPEQALEILKKALRVYQDAPEEYQNVNDYQYWVLENNLGLTYFGLATGSAPDRDMMGKAIEAMQEALKISSGGAAEWIPRKALTLDNLGAALTEKSRAAEGAERIDLLGQAVGKLKESVEIRTGLAFPRQWFLFNCPIFQQAPDPLSMRKFRDQWAKTMRNLGDALAEQGGAVGGIEGRALLQEAIGAYQAVIDKVYKRQGDPEEWAKTMHNMGDTMYDIAKQLDGPDKINSLRQAIETYKEALQVRTKAASIAGYANTQGGLGDALSQLAAEVGCPEGPHYLDEAIGCYEEALAYYKNFSRGGRILQAKTKALTTRQQNPCPPD